ncbi:MAG: glycosyltransferase family 4 protein [Acidobacteriota bacterium]|nr:glycosyltransferase family 4 protein [Acidobacteriota bacterium]MDQ2843252.1 glycosyltransferase family 4 protein [Acidobacteriota bacterium]
MNTPLHVVMHTPEPGSGAGRYVYELTRALASNGWKATLLAPDNFEYRHSLSRETQVEFSALGLRPNESGRGLLGRTIDNVRFLLHSCLAQYRTMRKCRVIHFQFPLHLPFGLVPFLLAKLCGLKIIFTAHDPVPHKWLFPAPWNRIERWSLACIYRLSDRVIVHSAAGFKTVTEKFAVPAGKLAVIAHGPFSVASHAEQTPQSDGLNVLLFGALRENKGIHVAIEAVQHLVGQGIPIRLTIAGETPNGKEADYWGRCECLLAHSSAGIEVRKRYIQEEEIPALLAQSHCVLLPYTDFSSDSGIAALALSNAKPIIATSSGGLGELLRAAEVGITIKKPSVEGVEEALLTAWRAGRDELRRLGQNGAAHILENCSWSVAARKTGDLYRELLPLKS